MLYYPISLAEQKQITERLDYLSQKNHSTTRNLLQKNPKPNRTKKLHPKTSLSRRTMIKKIDIDIVEEKDKLLEILQKTTQSANLNFLIGAGCSTPALKALGNTEQKIQDYITNGKRKTFCNQ